LAHEHEGHLVTQDDKGRGFQALHARPGTFVIPNPWDVGSARLLASAGFEALATTSAGFAFSRGLGDHRVGRDAMLAHVAELATATHLPTSGDLENGFGDTPEIAAETIRLAAGAGLVGGSIEDGTGDTAAPLYEIAHAADRVRAAAEAAHTLPFPFVLTARAENFLVGRADLRDVIARLQAYQEAGADVLYAPGLVTADDISAVVRSVDRPVNVLMGLPGCSLDLAALAAIGVRRVSVGSGLARAAFGALLRAVDEINTSGTFTFGASAATSRDLTARLAR
jgi:2-methylisocitrate lyase-like PEP mutase family enzyme